MGGWGSGRQGGRVSVEGCASCRLGIKDLGPLLRAPPGAAAWMHYRRDGEHLLTVRVEARPGHGCLRLRHPSRASGHTEDMDYAVGLTSTAVGFGCPLSGRRCAVLYLPRGGHRFGSAEGYGLAYAVTRMEEHDRLRRRMARIAQRLGDEPDPELPPRRPKGMRTATHERLLKDWHRTSERRDRIFDAKLAGFAARLGRLGG